MATAGFHALPLNKAVMPLGERMIRKTILTTFGSIFCLMAGFTQAGEVVINKEMEAALRQFNPRFVVWETSDYAATIQKGALRDNREPYALILDVNGDRTSDLVLDGHDDKNSLLICLLSTPKGYDVVVIRQIDLRHPKEIVNFNDGVKEMGLNYYLWPNKQGTGFTLAYPQQSDSEGKLLKDGAIYDYTFENGKFHENYQIP